MNLGEFFFGSSPKVNDYSVLSPQQQQLLTQVSGYISSGLKQGATPSSYSPYAATPDILTQAFQTGGSLFGVGQNTIIDALTRQAGGVPAYRFDAGQSAKLWNESFATPLMSSYKENIAPIVRESYNIPGMANSSLAARGEADAASRYFAENVQPSLWNAYSQGMQNEFASAENAAARQLSGATALGQLPYLATSGALSLGSAQLSESQRILSALRGEESRLFSENNPWLQNALGLSTANTSENIANQGQQGQLWNLISGGAGLASLGSQGINLGSLASFFAL